MPTDSLLALTLALYLASTVWMLLRLRVGHPNPAPGVWILAVPALGLHGLILAEQMVTGSGIYIGIASAASLSALLTASLVLILSVFLPLNVLLSMILPVAATALGVSQLTASQRPLIDPSDTWLGLHISVSLVAYSLLMAAALQAAVLVWAERRLRPGPGLQTHAGLPPLESLESSLFALIWAGFIGLSLAIASGLAGLEDMFAQHVAHHTLLACVSWLLYGVLLVSRWRLGWRGLVAVRWTVIAFAFLLIGYFGSKFVLEILLQRS